MSFSHVFGITYLMCANMYNLSKIVTVPKFSNQQFFRLLFLYKPHVLFLVPKLVNLLSSNTTVKPEDLNSVRFILSGSAPLGVQDEEKLRLKTDNDCLAYGLTETSPIVLLASKRSLNLSVSGTVGELVPNTSVRLAKVDNPDFEIHSPYEPGELMIKGPQVMKGYYKRKHETESAFVDGWFKTGGLVHYDEHKMFFVTERLKEMIKVKGHQVAPAELEEILRHHPDLLEAGVIGVPHEVYGEVPRAYVVLKPNHKVNVENINKYVSENVANYKQLRGGIRIVDHLPKTSTLKISRSALRKSAGSGE